MGTGSRIVVVRSGENIITGLVDDNGLAELQVDKLDEGRMLGNIYLGKVKNIVKNINAAFVEVEDGKMCYLSISEVRNPVFAANDHPGKLRVGDELIVQITKESAKYKAPLATVDFNLTGKYVVLVHGRSMLGISQKIKEPEVRDKLKNIIKPYISDQYGFIVRTNAATAPDNVLEREIRRLVDDYRSIVEFGVHWTCFSRLYSTPPSYVWEIRDTYADDITEIRTDDKEIYEEIKNYLSFYQPEDINKLSLYNDEMLPLIKLYGIEEKLNKALHDRVWLDSGAYIIIQPTEALTVIDVNTGRAISGKTDTETTFYDVNKEAAAEIARQIRLRNLSGIIIIDFIDMKDEVMQKRLLGRFETYLSKDRIPTKLVDMTSLGLVEVTRKKIRRPLADQVRGYTE